MYQRAIQRYKLVYWIDLGLGIKFIKLKTYGRGIIAQELFYNKEMSLPNKALRLEQAHVYGNFIIAYTYMYIGLNDTYMYTYTFS